MTAFSTDGLESLLDGPSPAVLTTYRMDGSALVSPVWFRYADEAFEVVVAEGDVKLRHLARDPRAVLVVFEAAPPFRGVEVRGDATVVPGDVSRARVGIASRYLGRIDGERFAAQRASRPGVLVRLAAGTARSWDLTAILPD
ncbi:MAG TPA: TIGR03618 family F420-dependent PPOX class oxidoreductase [Gaiellales bacterium]